MSHIDLFMLHRKLCLMLLISMTTLPFVVHAEENALDNLMKMSLQELQNVKVTSVSKRPEDPFEAAAAVYVVTADDIRRAGAVTIPDILRTVPGIEVAQIDTNKWAVTSRGFNGQFSNKLLVLVDGRTVYTPLFSGVFWNIQDTVLEDISRIEVIRGPGATLWGSNAVNGVINIITKGAENTQGTYISTLAGNEERVTGEARYGGKIGEDFYYRVFAKHFDRTPSQTLQGVDAGDDTYLSRTGFRADWRKTDFDKITVIGDIYSGMERQIAFLPTGLGSVRTDVDERVKGGSINSRWNHTFSKTSRLSIQTYIDHIERNTALLDQERTTFDVDIQHNWDISDRNELTWGVGYRYFQDDLDEKNINGTTYLNYTPDNSNNNIYSAFIQDKLTIVPEKLFLTLGSKFEHHYFTGLEVQPNVRVSYLITDRQTLWGAVTRAVRSPTRGEDGLDLVLSSTLSQDGSEFFKSEELVAYELGYRYQPNWRMMFDATVFYNDYDSLRTFENDGLGNLVANNNSNGEGYGFELASRYSVTRNWNLYANYSFLTLDIHLNDGATEIVDFSEKNEGLSAKHRVSLMSRVNLTKNIELDNNLYFVDNLPEADVDAYIRFDTRIGWRPTKYLELSLVGQNLFDDQHKEFSQSLYSVPSEVGRSIYGRASLRF